MSPYVLKRSPPLIAIVPTIATVFVFPFSIITFFLLIFSFLPFNPLILTLEGGGSGAAPGEALSLRGPIGRTGH